MQSSNSIVSGLLNQEITAISSVARDGYGRITKTALYTEVPCRWQERYQMVMDRTGVEVVSRIQAWIPDEIDGEILDVDEQSIITFGGRDYTVISTENRYNIMGEREYIKLFLK